MTFHINSNGLSDTVRLGEQIGANCQGGEVIQLVSDLGGGKTALVQGIARGMNSVDPVASPTFTIGREYRTAGKLELHHFDFFRLDDAGVVAEELAESIDNPHVVTALEWADVAQRVLPNDRLVIVIKTTGERSRSIHLTFGKKHEHLIKGIA
jgi:tRNA threonylcarbamoyladenosine biosynthesis protein TsaE